MSRLAAERRRGCRAVDVVIAEHGDRLAAHDRLGDAHRRFRHGGKHVGVGHRLLDRRIEKCRDGIVPLRNGQRARSRARRAGPAKRVRSPSVRRRGKGGLPQRTRVIQRPLNHPSRLGRDRVDCLEARFINTQESPPELISGRDKVQISTQTRPVLSVRSYTVNPLTDRRPRSRR